MELTRFDVETLDRLKMADWDVVKKIEGTCEVVGDAVIKVPILERVEAAFHKFNCPDWPCSGVWSHHWEEKEQLQIFSWPGPRWSSPGGFLFHCNTWDRHFFYRHKLLTFLSTTVSHCEAADRLFTWDHPRSRDWKIKGGPAIYC